MWGKNISDNHFFFEMYFQAMVISFMKLSIKIHTITIKPQTIMAVTKEAALKNQEAAKFKKETLFKRDQAYTTTTRTRTTPQFIPTFLPIPFLSVGLKKLRTHQIVTK